MSPESVTVPFSSTGEVTVTLLSAGATFFTAMLNGTASLTKPLLSVTRSEKGPAVLGPSRPAAEKTGLGPVVSNEPSPSRSHS